MKREYISDTIGNISTQHIKEAENYEPEQRKSSFFKRPSGRVILAASLALCLIVGGIGVFSPRHGIAVTAYAHGTDEELTAAGAVINTGTISDTGEMTGQPLMFYLSGKDIDTVRFSCKNQQINFMDWTEKRDEYGNAQNFTVPYGKDTSEYYYLTIEWVPDSTIRELTDNRESTIATLPDELREDIIVMEITFANGKTATKAITVSLLDDGRFFAAFDNYKIKENDTFVTRPDSEVIPREVLYAPTKNDTLVGTVETILNSPFETIALSEDEALKIKELWENGNWEDSTAECINNVNISILDKSVLYHSDCGTFNDRENQKHLTLDSASKEIVNTILEKYLVLDSVERPAGTNSDTLKPFDSAIEEIAKEYYSDTVFEVVSMELKSQTENEIVFSVCVSKNGVVQEPDRTIWLEFNNGKWEVTNEGY